jgi:HSP20 family protein
MANLIRRRERELAPLAGWESSLLDPLRVARDLFRMDPFQELGGLSIPWIERPFAPDIDMKETKEAYVFTADLPGIRDEDVDVSVMGDMITIRGQREEEKTREDERYYAHERSCGSFSRSFTLPVNANPEAIQADLANGVLRVSVQKRPEMLGKRIPIQSQSAKQIEGGKAPEVEKKKSA